MANKQIYQLTETLSVSPDDWLAIDLDSSNVTRKARVGNVFSVSEGSSYSGGTTDGIMFNDGNTFTTSTNLVFDGTKLIINNPATNPATVYIKSDGTTGLGGDRVFALEGNLPEMWFKDTFGGGSGMAIRKYNNQFYIVNTNSSGAFLNYVSNVQLPTGMWTIGAGSNPLGQLDVRVQNAGIIGQLINLSNGQTADAFQINSYGNTGGDLFRVDSDGDVTVSSGRIYGETSNQYVLLDNAVGSGFYYDSQNYIYHGGRFEVVAGNVSSMSVRNSKSSFNTPLYIGGFDVTPDASSILEINSTTKGMLPPRMTTTERDAIASPATGLSIFNTTTAQPEYYSGTAWEGAAGGGVSIGDSIGGASVTQVLFADASGLLAQNSRFVFTGTSLNFTGAGSSSTSNSSYGLNAASGNFGSNNTSIGNGSNYNSNGSLMTSIGVSAGVFATSNDSVFIGVEAGYQSNGNRSVFAGYRAGRLNAAASCVGIGDYALFNTGSLSSGVNNAALGSNSQNSSAGTQNTSVGARSLLSNNSSYSTGVGYQAGWSNTGDYVLALGYNAGVSNTQANRVIVGQQNLPSFGIIGTDTVADADAAAAAALPAAGANGVYLYWNAIDNTIKARP